MQTRQFVRGERGILVPTAWRIWMNYQHPANLRRKKRIFKGNYLNFVEEFLVTFVMFQKISKEKRVYESKWHIIISL